MDTSPIGVDRHQEGAPPEYLILGHVTRDLTPDGPLRGGTCSYAGVTASRLGARVAIVTVAGSDIPASDDFRAIPIKCGRHPESTTFENIYEKGRRRQKLYAVSGSLSFDMIPEKWRRAPVVHLAPMAQEFSPILCRHFTDSLVCATMQGWVRGRDGRNNVILEPHPDLRDALPGIDVLVMSLEDVKGDSDLLRKYLTSVRVGVETLGPEGCRVYAEGRIMEIPVEREVEVDPTGAGDIFAGAFFVKYKLVGDYLYAARFANACASLSVRHPGWAGAPFPREAEERMSAIYPEA